MTSGDRTVRKAQGGTGLVEILVALAIGMLVVMLTYDVYAINEAQKRTLTFGNSALENASYAALMIARDVAAAGNGISSSATALDRCTLLRPVPVLITAGTSDAEPDSVTVFYGGSASLSTPVALLSNSTITGTSAGAYQVPSPVGFSANDLIAAVQGPNCTLSRINAGGVSVSDTSGIATITHTPIAGNMSTTYGATSASLVNLGPTTSLGDVAYSVDPATETLQTRGLLPALTAATPVSSGIVNMKVRFGLDTTGAGTVDSWQEATGAWSAANLPAQPLAVLRQIRAVRIAIVARSSQYEKDAVTEGPLLMFDGTVSMDLTADQQHYRYRTIETTVPLRNTVWNAS